MFLRTLSIVGLVLALGATSASAALRDDANPSYEWDLYQVYNEIYGTNFTSSAGATVGLGGPAAGVTGGMDALLVNPDSIFVSNPSAAEDSNAFFIARYAGQDQRFGYYEAGGVAPSGTSNTVPGTGDFHHLFDVVGDTNVIITDGDFNPANVPPGGGIGTIPLGDFPIGFYLNSPLGGSVTYLSEAIYNADGGVDHMLTYRVIDPATGDIVPDTYILAWEDRPGLTSDMDYNDLVVQIYIPGSGTRIPLIPEPTTAGLLVLGLAAAAVRRRFTA